MERWKKAWTAFLHWPGWTGWLKWEGWRKIGHWSGWKKLLYPHPALVILLSVITFGGVLLLFLTGNEGNPLAGVLYAGAFYALVTLVVLLVKWIPRAKDKIDHDPMAQKIKESSDGAFGIGMYGEQFINFFYGIFKIAAGVLQRSAWIGADGIYNLAQALIQLYQILRHKQARSMEQQWKSYRQCGYMMIVLHLTMTGMVYQMIQMGRHEEYTEITIIATAAFTFYKLINTFISVAKDRKHKNPVDSAVHFLNFAQALYNLFVLQVGLLWVFGGRAFAYGKLMNSLTGGAVCLLVLGMGIYMLWRANRDIKKTEETEIG